MEREITYFGLGQRGHCTCCGAGIHNNYQHNRNCRLNLSKNTPELVAAYQRGWDARITTGKLGVFQPEPLDAEEVAERMGNAMADTIEKQRVEEANEALVRHAAAAFAKAFNSPAPI